MDYGELGIILAIVGVGLGIISLLGNNKLNKLSMKIDSKFNKLSTQIERIEIRLEGELSRINSEVGLLREKNTMKLEELNNNINYRIKDLENLIHASNMSVTAKKGESSDDEYARHTRPRSPRSNQRRT